MPSKTWQNIAKIKMYSVHSLKKNLVVIIDHSIGQYVGILKKKNWF